MIRSPNAINSTLKYLSDAQVQNLISSKNPDCHEGEERVRVGKKKLKREPTGQSTKATKLGSDTWSTEQRKPRIWFSRDKQLCTRSAEGCTGNVRRSLFLGFLAGQSCGFLGFPSAAGKFCTACLLTYLQHLRWSWGCVSVADWHNNRSHSCFVLSYSILRAGNLMITCGGTVKLQPFYFKLS